MRRTRRGFTLIETMVALVCLVIGLTGVTALLTHLSNANRHLAFQNTALDAFALFSAQVADAACDVMPGEIGLRAGPVDPGLMPTAGFVNAPVRDSAIQIVGTIPGTPSLILSYEVQDGTAATGVDTTGHGGPPSLDIAVRIREVTGNPAQDDPSVTSGYWIREFPVKKVCNLRSETSRRGEL